MEQNFTIAAVMTAPRYEATYARNYIERAVKELNIPLTVSLGVFYGQCMQTMMERLVASEVELIVTIDFDSLFNAKQLQRLINLLVSNEEIDAITCMQQRRGRPVMLGTVPGGKMLDADTKQVEWNGNPVKATTAHFGLTVIDAKKLASVSKPWFFAQPDENGSWTGDSKIDDDVWFWNQWAKAGNSIYIDFATRIGHLEEMVAIHGEDAKPQHIYPSEWEKLAYASDTN